MPSITHVGGTFFDTTARAASGTGAIDNPEVVLSSGDIPGGANSVVVLVCRGVSNGGGTVTTPTGMTATTASTRTTTGAGASRTRVIRYMYARRGDLTFPLTVGLGISTSNQDGAYLAVTPVVLASVGDPTAAVNQNSNTTTTTAQDIVIADTRGAVILNAYTSFDRNRGLDNDGGLTPPSAVTIATANSFTLESDDVTNQEHPGWPFSNLGFETFGLASRIVTTDDTYALPVWNSTIFNVVTAVGWEAGGGGIYVDGAVHLS